jgi:DNA-binding HxlR family transcriptional regulator
MRWNELDDVACSLARTVGVIGDRWSLLVLRDCFLRVRRFEDFQRRLGVSRAILADRLDKLVDNFVLTKVAYQERPVRYEYRLTDKGLALYPVIMAMVHWGDVFLAGKKGRPVLHRHSSCKCQFDPVMVCSECAEEVLPRAVEVIPGPGVRDAHNLPLGSNLGSSRSKTEGDRRTAKQPKRKVPAEAS